MVERVAMVLATGSPHRSSGMQYRTTQGWCFSISQSAEMHKPYLAHELAVQLPSGRHSRFRLLALKQGRPALRAPISCPESARTPARGTDIRATQTRRDRRLRLRVPDVWFKGPRAFKTARLRESLFVRNHHHPPSDLRHLLAIRFFERGSVDPSSPRATPTH